MDKSLHDLGEAIAALDAVELAEFERWAFQAAGADRTRPRVRRLFHALGLVATEHKAAQDDTARQLLDSVDDGKGERIDDPEAFLRGIHDAMQSRRCE